MNPQLARIGRLEPERSAARFAREFQPGATRLIHVDGAFAGCVTVHQDNDAWRLEHFYLTPDHQAAAWAQRSCGGCWRRPTPRRRRCG